MCIRDRRYILGRDYWVGLKVVPIVMAAEMFMGMPTSVLNDIIKGRRAITPEVAVLLQEILSIDASYWLSLQNPVSYTHLDVYKRQVLSVPKGNARSPRNRIRQI